MNLLNVTPLAFFVFTAEALCVYLIIALIVFFITRRILKSSFKSRRTRMIATSIITLVATPILYEVFIVLLLLYITHTPTREFDKTDWLANKKRHEMADHIIATKLLIGKDTNQVKDLLGPPTWNIKKDSSFVYDMGMGGGGLGFMFHRLELKVVDNKVIAIKHAQIPD